MNSHADVRAMVSKTAGFPFRLAFSLGTLRIS
jgi:hypothetical protein